MPPNHYRPAGRGYTGRPDAPRLPPLNTSSTHPGDVYHAQPQNDYRSRYNPRYDDRRSRSPRDRSPDRLTDRGSQYGDGDRRRTSAESRTNVSTFQSNRDSFREPLTGREPPRAPKAYLDPPSGPRGGGYAGDFRGRGRGGRGGRGGGWRDESRDRGRERDFRDRRDDPPPFRNDRSRERERDWRDRERDSFRGRRASPGPRRSPPGRDFRDRDLQIGVEADRARRGSRDGGPLSAGSSSSDPPFGAQLYRGSGYRGRGGPRGRGDWERGRGRPFLDERPDPRFRSRSQEGRWGGPRDRDERDSHRFADTDMRPRDSMRDERELFPPRDPRDTTERNVRPKIDRQGSVANEPSSASTVKAITPPLAPVPPAFGSAPTRPPPASDTSKAPPTGPRALTEDRQDRPVSSGQPGGDSWAPPSGPSKSISPTIPTGPRAQQMQKQPRPSSKQWINPALVGTKVPPKVPESPKMNRSQSFASPQPGPFGQRPDTYSNRQSDDVRRPRSSGAGYDGDGLRPLSIPDPGDGKIERGTQSARASIDRDMRLIPWKSPDMKAAGPEASDGASNASAISPTAVKTTSPALSRPVDQHDERPDDPMQEDGEIIDEPPAKKKRRLNINGVRFSLPVKPPAAPAAVPLLDQASDSDDEEITEEYFVKGIEEAEAELQKLGEAATVVPSEIALRYAHATHEALVKIAIEKEGLKDMLGHIPDGIVLPTEKEVVPAPAAAAADAPTAPVAPEASEASEATEAPEAPAVPAKQATPLPLVAPAAAVAPVAEMSTIAEIAKPEIEQAAASEGPSHVVETDVPTKTVSPEPQPKIEEMDVDSAHVPIPTVEKPEPQDEQGDIVMEDAQMNGSENAHAATNGVSGHVEHQHLAPPGLDAHATATNSPTPMEEEEDVTDVEIDDVTLELVRADMKTPPVEDLPHFSGKPWYQSKQALRSMESNPDVENYIARVLKQNATFASADQDEKKMEYKVKYEEYLRFTQSDDPIAAKSRDVFNKANAPVDGVGPAPVGAEPRSEGRRTGRFATERDVERVMAQSLLEAREKEERETRAEKLKHPRESEAVIPDMYWTEEDRKKELFVDTSGFLDPEKLVAKWQVLPPEANFTTEEAGQFEKAYLEFPKQWGKIAEAIPGRDFHACIQYYYLKKHTLNLKEKLKKQPKKRKKGKTKARSSALAYELGNPDENQEEAAETGENGERRARPRRAAAPTFDFEKPAESAEGTPAATPGGRRGPGSKADSSAEKTEKPRRKRATKEKEPKQPKTPQVLAPTPGPGGKGARSRSNSKVPPPAELLPTQNPTAEMGRVPLSFEPRNSPMPVLPPSIATVPGHSISQTDKPLDIMAPPSLRPEPVPPLQSNVATFELGPLGGIAGPSAVEPERSGRATPAAGGASSYWSVVEQSEFPDLLRSFGTNWPAISQHMTTKTPTMVKNFYTRRGNENPDWARIASEADAKASQGEKLPPPPTPTAGPRNKKYDIAPSHRHTVSTDGAVDEIVPSKVDKQPPPINTNFPRPIAQAPAQQQVQPQVAMGQSPMIDRTERPERVERKPLSSQPGTPSLEPAGRHVRSSSTFISDRDGETLLPQQQQQQQPQQQQQQQMRHALKPAPMSAVEQPPTLPSQSMPSRAGFTDWDPHANILSATARQRKPQVDLQPKDDLRQAPPLKQEPDSVPHFEPLPSQPPSRPMSTKPMPMDRRPEPTDRRPEPPRTTAPPPPQAFAPVATHQIMQREPPRESIRDPQMNMREPQMSMREPQMNMRESQLNMREPPQMSMREPPTNMREPPMSMREPPTSMREPPTNMREPPTNMREPPTNMREPQTNIREPQLNIREPQMNMREPQMVVTPVDERRVANMPGRVPNPSLVDRVAENRLHNPSPVEGPSRIPNPNLVEPGPPRVPNPNMMENGPPRVPNPSLVETPTRGPQPGYFDNAYAASPSRPSPSPAAAPLSKAPEPRKTSNVFSLLNDDPAPPPAAPKRVDEVARGGMSTTSSPPPGRPQAPPSAPPHMRREETPTFSPYARTPAPSAMPSLKPYSTPHTQSPQTQHVGVTRPPIVSPVEAVPERDYYGRPSYGTQHQVQSSGSPHQPHHYPSPNQQSPMVYQPQPTSYPGYGAPVSQSHAPSPTMQYAHPTSRSREPTRDSYLRESVPPARETQWPAPQSQPGSATRLQQETSWPVPKPTPAPPQQSPWGSQHAPPGKFQQMRETSQPTWSAAPPSHLGRDPRDQRDPRDPRGDPRDPRDLRDLREARDPRDERYAMGSLRESVPPRDLRDERYSILETQQRAAPDPRMADPRMAADPRDPRDPRNDPRLIGHHHQHSHSGSLGRVYISSSPAPREAMGVPPPGPPQGQTPVFPRYSTPAPRDSRDLRDVVQAPSRSYTPMSSQHHQYEMQMRAERDRREEYRAAEMMREREMRVAEMQAQQQQQREQELRLRDMHAAAADLRDMQQYGRPAPVDYHNQPPPEFRGELRGAPPPPQQDHRGVDLRRQLRPHEGYPPGPGDRRYG